MTSKIIMDSGFQFLNNRGTRQSGLILEAAVSGVGNLDSVLASETVFQINPVVGANATQPNVITSPADSELQTAYDFIPGLTAVDTNADPLFVSGTPDYMEYDGDDCQTLVGTNTDFINDLHKTTGGQAATIMAAFRTDANFGSAQTIWASLDLGDHGVRLIITGGGNIQIQQRSNVSQSNYVDELLTVSTDYLIFAGFDFTNSDDVEYWVNTSTGSTNSTATPKTSTTDPAGQQFRIGAVADATPSLQFLMDGSRTYEIAAFNELLTDAKVATAKTNVEARLGISF